MASSVCSDRRPDECSLEHPGHFKLSPLSTRPSALNLAGACSCQSQSTCAQCSELLAYFPRLRHPWQIVPSLPQEGKYTGRYRRCRRVSQRLVFAACTYRTGVIMYCGRALPRSRSTMVVNTIRLAMTSLMFLFPLLVLIMSFVRNIFTRVY